MPNTPQNQSVATNGTQLNCFSPPVMIATFVIETLLALYTVWRYKLNLVGRLAAALLVFLGLFQLSEYFVCGGIGMSNVTWARIGYVAITTLPPLGLHLMYALAGRKERGLVMTAYATGLAFSIFFLGYSGAFTGYQCTGNYVIFQLAINSGMAYGIYYYLWLAISIFLGVSWQANTQLTLGVRQAMRALVVGYLVFIVPTAVTNTLKPETMRGIPSIMCGFAVIFALILAFYILPRGGRKKLETPTKAKA